MYQTILVPLDGSTFAESAIPPALSIAERSGGEIHLVSVVSPLDAFDRDLEGEGFLNRWLRGRKARTLQYLEELKDRIVETGTSAAVHAHVLSGQPVRALHEWILQESVDQVVMTTHGRGGFERLWMGSVADGLIRRVPSPVLLWRPGTDGVHLADRPAFRRILVSLDGSELAEAILLWAGELARLFEARISLVSVVPGPPLVASPYLPHTAEEEKGRDAKARELESYLADLADRTLERHIRVETALLRGPSAAEGILAHQEEIDADLMALSTRGRGKAARLVMGSVADKVIRASKGHVLVHRDTEEQ